jgi:hypothetical protein
MTLRKGSNEEWVFNLLKVRADPDTNIVKFNPLDSGNKDKFYKGFAILKMTGCVHKISNGVFLINPNILRPFHPHYQNVLKHWFELTSKVF